MKLEEFKYLVDNNYITDTQIGGFYLDPKNSDALAALEEFELVQKGYLTQVGFAPLYHSFKITYKPEGCKVIINGEERDFGMFPDKTKINWSVEKEGYTSQNGEFVLEYDDDEDIVLVAIEPTPTTPSEDESKPEDTPVVTPNDSKPTEEAKDEPIKESVEEKPIEKPAEETKDEPIKESVEEKPKTKKTKSVK